jgi:putative transposase
MLGKHTLDAAFSQFFNILSYVCWKRGVFFSKVSKDYTSQICPECGYKTHRDVAAAQVIRNREILAVGQPVGLKISSGGVSSGGW